MVRVDSAATPLGDISLNWCLDDVYEPNDTLETAAPLTSGEPVDGILCDDVDYFSIDAAAGETVTADLTWDPTAAGPMTLQLVDADGNVLGEVVDSEAGSESISRQVVGGGSHFIHISGGNGPTAYVIQGGAFGSIGRFEGEGGEGFSLSSGWWVSQNVRRSAGAGMATSTPGRWGEFVSEGPVVRVIGERGPGRALVDVKIDGVSYGTIDLSSGSAGYQRVVFAAEDLSAGVHRLRLEHAGTGSVVVDAIEALRADLSL